MHGGIDLDSLDIFKNDFNKFNYQAAKNVKEIIKTSKEKNL